MNSWRVEDFITYLYHIAADADLTTDDVEIASSKIKISEILKTYFPGIDFRYDECMSNIRNTKDVNIFNVKEVVTTLAKKFHFSADLKTDIVSDLHDVVRSDELVTSGEHEAVNYIRMLLKNA
ncbi:MAG TPA: hypothetical protein VL947_14190 [Cytophagales bacterium]|nr:hypothetical protein [Cytophagales bacterium]